MKEKKEEMIVGLVVTLALLLLVLGVVWGKKTDFLSKRIRLTVHFENVKGLEKGDPVVIRGIAQGEVDDVDLGDDFAEVRLWINSKAKLWSDAQFLIEDRDLMGGKQILIEPGHGPESLNPEITISGNTRYDMLQVLVSGGRVISQIDSLLSRINDVAGSDRLKKVIKNFEDTSNEAKNILEDNRASIHATLKQMEGITRKFHEDSVAARVSKTFIQLDSTISSVRRLVLEAEKEDGTLKRLIKDKKLFERLVSTTSDLDSLIQDVKKHPSKYIHVSIF
jgi:phospholipid/cholesterol/gamma-HCH transport system substrate-binding protein